MIHLTPIPIPKAPKPECKGHDNKSKKGSGGLLGLGSTLASVEHKKLLNLGLLSSAELLNGLGLF
jgi:hypothetical protein